MYRSDGLIRYSANVTYHVRIVADVATHRYSAWVRALQAGAKEVPVGENYAFRTQQQAVTALDRWGAFADIGSLTACNGVAYSSLKPARRLRFDGIKDYVEIPDRDALGITTTGALTVSAWIRPSTLKFSKP